MHNLDSYPNLENRPSAMARLLHSINQSNGTTPQTLQAVYGWNHLHSLRVRLQINPTLSRPLLTGLENHSPFFISPCPHIKLTHYFTIESSTLGSSCTPNMGYRIR
jgi:hypothetical protein